MEKSKVQIKSVGGNVSFSIDHQSFTLRHIEEDTKEDTEQSIKFYKDMLKVAFERLGAKVEIL